MILALLKHPTIHLHLIRKQHQHFNIKTNKTDRCSQACSTVEAPTSLIETIEFPPIETHAQNASLCICCLHYVVTFDALPFRLAYSSSPYRSQEGLLRLQLASFGRRELINMSLVIQFAKFAAVWSIQKWRNWMCHSRNSRRSLERKRKVSMLHVCRFLDLCVEGINFV